MPWDPKTLHKYLYVGGNPVNRIDPRGLADFAETGMLDNISITFGHGMRHLVGTALTQAEVEEAIQAATQEIIDTCILNPGMNIYCVVNVGGIDFLAKIFVVTAAWINVGTYYPL
jgi:hypothetical protein